MTNVAGPSLYEVLEVPREASPATLRRAYRRRSLATHPDKGGSDEAFRRVACAFEVLSSAAARARYDARIARRDRCAPPGRRARRAAHQTAEPTNTSPTPPAASPAPAATCEPEPTAAPEPAPAPEPPSAPESSGKPDENTESTTGEPRVNADNTDGDPRPSKRPRLSFAERLAAALENLRCSLADVDDRTRRRELLDKLTMKVRDALLKQMTSQKSPNASAGGPNGAAGSPGAAGPPGATTELLPKAASDGRDSEVVGVSR